MMFISKITFAYFYRSGEWVSPAPMNQQQQEAPLTSDMNGTPKRKKTN